VVIARCFHDRLYGNKTQVAHQQSAFKASSVARDFEVLKQKYHARLGVNFTTTKMTSRLMSAWNIWTIPHSLLDDRCESLWAKGTGRLAATCISLWRLTCRLTRLTRHL